MVFSQFLAFKSFSDSINAKSVKKILKKGYLNTQNEILLI